MKLRTVLVNRFVTFAVGLALLGLGAFALAWVGRVPFTRDSLARLDRPRVIDVPDQPWWTAALISWGIALFEYLLQVPANRIGYTALSLPQLKILQEVITLIVFVPFAIVYMGQPVKLDYLWAGICLLGAVYFIFRA